MRLTAIIWVAVSMATAAYPQPPTADKRADPKSAERLSHEAEGRIVAAMRQYAAAYTASLPNFTATQIIQRSTRALVGNRSKTLTIEEQLSIVDRRETHKVVKLDGRAATDVDTPSLGQYSRGEFGNLLAAIFNKEANTDFAWDHTGTLNGGVAHIFNFKVPAAAGYELAETGGRIDRVAYQGQIWADAKSNAVMRVQFACVRIPSKSSYKALDLTLDYKSIVVAGKTYILPSRNRLHVRTDVDMTDLDSEYKGYRRFGSESTLVFDDGAESDESPKK